VTFNEYQTAAMRTASPRLDLWYALAKLCSEAGEALQLQCKEDYHGKVYSRELMAEELGDLQWYLALAAQELGVSLDDIAAGNIAKLRSRHGATYNAEFYGVSREGAQ